MSSISSPFKDPLAEFIYYRTYSRWRDDLGRRENWNETVDRATKFLFKQAGDALTSQDRRDIYSGIHNHEALCSMRLLWAAGDAAYKNPVSIFNCSAAAVTDLRVFDEALFILMSGTGFGFSVEHEFIEDLPKIKRQSKNITADKYTVEDSREGWAKALRIGLETWFSGGDVEYDYSELRPAGARLLTMGGRSSGPEPLRRLLEFVRHKILDNQGRRLHAIDVHDIMCMIGEVVVAGGVRRSSLISLSDLDDYQMRIAKYGAFYNQHPYRAMSNNSVAYDERPSSQEFIAEFLNLIKSGSGERGIFNRESAFATAPRRKKYNGYLTNPCQPAYATVLTPQGISTIGEIEIGDSIWSGSKWTKVINKWSTGVKPVYEYLTTTGRFIGTENHRVVSQGEKIEVGKAESIDYALGPNAPVLELNPQDIMDGLVLGDGMVHKASNNLVLLNIGDNDQDYFQDEAISGLIKKERFGISDKAYEIITTITSQELPKTYLRSVPDRFYYAETMKKRGFLRGLYTANGSICGDRITLKQSSKTLILQVQEILSSLGIHSYITVNKAKPVQFSNGEYVCKQSYDLNITSGRTNFRETIGFVQNYKQEKIKDGSKPKYLTSNIKSVEYLEDTEVFDMTVEDEAHTYWTGGCLVSNCGEILLRDRQFCNLSSIIARPEDDAQTLVRKARIAAIIGTIQSTFTDFPYLSADWKKNCDEERLLGVSLSGQMDSAAAQDPSIQQLLRITAIETNREYAERLGINQSTAITCVKPEGTSSKMACSGSGLHVWWSKYYKQNIRISATDPLFKMLKDAGVPYEAEVGQDPTTASTWVVTFPRKAPESAKTRHDVKAIEQLEYWKQVKINFTEHNPSCTIYVKEEEWPAVMAWVYDNWKTVGGLSFLPSEDHVYRLAPYEQISEQEYNEMVKIFPTIDYSLLSQYEQDDNTTGAKDYACISGTCDLVI